MDAPCAGHGQHVAVAQPAAGEPHPGVVQGEPRRTAAHDVLHVQRAGLPVRECLLPRLQDLRDERPGAGRPASGIQVRLATHRARDRRASAGLDPLDHQRQLLPDEGDALPALLDAVQRHAADPNGVHRARRQDDHGCELPDG